MWWTPNGERVLRGAEGYLFAECVYDLLQEYDLPEGVDYSVGVQVFDGLSDGQKIGVLSLITHALLRTEVLRPELTAVTEGAVAAVFRHLLINVEVERVAGASGWRRLIIRARRETGGEDLPDEACCDAEEWQFQVQALEDRILWDADYESGGSFEDDAPENAAVLREMMGIHEDYFVKIAPDLSDQELRVARDEIMALCQRVNGPDRLK